MKICMPIVAATVALATIAGSAGQASAEVFCGSGVITSLSSNVPRGQNDTNLALRLDTVNANSPGSGAIMATYNGSSGWMVVNWTNETRFTLVTEVLQRAYLAGLPIRVWNNLGNDCGKMTDTTMKVQVCTSSSDCASTAAP